jgi:hypothetical protein
MTPIHAMALTLANQYEKIIYGVISREISRFKTSVKCAIEHCNGIIELDVWSSPHNAEQGKPYWEELKEELISML